MLNNKIKLFLNTEHRAVVAYRVYSHIYRKYSKFFGYFLYQYSKKKYNVDIAPTASIGTGFEIVHIGAIVIGRNVIIGKNVKVQSCVTIGMQELPDLMPKIGNNVYIGTGAKILGDVEIGDTCKIGANSVVIKSFPANSVIAGVPAKVIKNV